MNNITRDLAVYVLVRTDIPSMNPGKAMAQVHHAGVQMMAEHTNHPLVKDYLKAGQKGGAKGFNTTIVLGACLADIDFRLSLAKREQIPCISSAVVDPSYPFIVEREVWEWVKTMKDVPGTELENGKVIATRSETTCAWFLGDRNDPDFKNLFMGLGLHA